MGLIPSLLTSHASRPLAIPRKYPTEILDNIPFLSKIAECIRQDSRKWSSYKWEYKYRSEKHRERDDHRGSNEIQEDIC